MSARQHLNDADNDLVGVLSWRQQLLVVRLYWRQLHALQLLSKHKLCLLRLVALCLLGKCFAEQA